MESDDVDSLHHVRVVGPTRSFRRLISEVPETFAMLNNSFGTDAIFTQ
jgi:hypothetical protein